ncbi:hypothetical protein BHM03_00042936, partial [Ensete ventricosum]
CPRPLHPHCTTVVAAPADVTAVLYGRQPPCGRRRRSVGWPRAGAAPTASPRASSPLRASRWQRAVLLPACGLPAGAAPAADR